MFGAKPYMIHHSETVGLDGKRKPMYLEDFEIFICNDPSGLSRRDLMNTDFYQVYHRKTYKNAIDLICSSIWFPPYKWYYRQKVINNTAYFLHLDRNGNWND